MISPDEIKTIALRWWEPLLQSAMAGNDFFPKIIDRIKKVQPADITQRFESLQKEIEILNRNSKSYKGLGYSVKTAEHNFRRTGAHQLPESIVFENLEDYLYFTNKKKEWELFLRNYDLIIKTMPLLREWALNNSTWLTIGKTNWPDLLKVCRYFVDTPRPNLFIRQLPITVHTKFIEENSALTQSLLDFLISDHIRNASQKRFPERYFLRYDEPLIRLRVLDASQSCFGGFSDLSIPLSDFERLNIPVKNILITENKMNFLALPQLSSTIAIWSGGGFNVSYLKKAAWLSNKKIFYWGDIDEHGFHILHQVRIYYPHTQSVLMDNKTFEAFAEYSVVGERSKSELPFLLDEEKSLFEKLKLSEKNRLEQEKILQVYVDECLKRSIEQEDE